MDKVETPKNSRRSATRCVKRRSKFEHKKRNKQLTENKKPRRSQRKNKWTVGPPQPSVLDNSFRSKISDIVEIFRNEMAINSRKNSLKTIFQVT